MTLLGCFSGGAVLTTGLGCAPESFGSWSVSTRGSVPVLGNHVGEAAEASGGDDLELVANVQLAAAY